MNTFTDEKTEDLLTEQINCCQNNKRASERKHSFHWRARLSVSKLFELFVLESTGIYCFLLFAN